MAYEDWPKHEATAKIAVEDRSKLVRRIWLHITRDIDAQITLTGNGHTVTLKPLYNGVDKTALGKVIAADTVDIEARGPDAVVIVAAVRGALENRFTGNRRSVLTHVQDANWKRGRPSLSPYTVETHPAWFGTFDEYWP